MDHAEIRRGVELAKEEMEGLGGFVAFKSGEWLLKLVQRSLQKNARLPHSRYFAERYPGLDAALIFKKLANAAAAKTALAGALAGTAVSLDELVAFFTAGEAGVGIPANIALALTAICAELFYVTKVQLQLILDVAALQGAEIDANSTEDLLALLSLAMGHGLARKKGTPPMSAYPVSKADV